MGDAIPRKAYYKIGEVCQYTDTQPYVLRFWESEFPQLAPEKNRSGQRVYRRDDIELILKIKKLLYEQEYTISGARQRLEQEASGEFVDDDRPSLEPREDDVAVEEARRDDGPPRLFETHPPGHHTMAEARAALEDLLPGEIEASRAPASDDIEALRARLSLLEDNLRRADAARVAAEALRDAYRARMDRVASRLEEAAGRLEEDADSAP